MTKAEYIDFIRNSLKLEDKTNKYHPKQVEAAINSAVNTVFYELYDQDPRGFRKSMERYSVLHSPITVDPAVSGTSGRYESALTFDVVDLPRKTGGILEIFADNQTPSVLKFVPITTMEGEQLTGAESSLPGNVVGFSFSGPRTIEYWDMSAAEATTSVVVRAIRQFKSNSSTDNVLLPYGQDERIIELTRKYLGAIPPKDLVNDNADANG